MRNYTDVQLQARIAQKIREFISDELNESGWWDGAEPPSEHEDWDVLYALLNTVDVDIVWRY